jgi:hypothetical protein
MAVLTFDLTGLPLLENEVAALVAQQAANPSSFTGGQSFTATYNALRSGAPPGGPVPATGTITTAALIQRLQALLNLAQTLPQ